MYHGTSNHIHGYSGYVHAYICMYLHTPLNIYVISKIRIMRTRSLYCKKYLLYI